MIGDILQEIVLTDIILSFTLAVTMIPNYGVDKPLWKRFLYAYVYVYMIYKHGQIGIDAINANEKL